MKSYGLKIKVYGLKNKTDMKTQYKSLSKMEKIAEIQDVNYCREEKREAELYIKALLHDEIETINFYENFGDTPRQMIMNKRDHDRQLLFGFTDIAFNEYGWLVNPKFLDIEEFKFQHRKGWAVLNHISIGRGINGKWTFGRSYSYSTGGSGYGLCQWGKIYNSRKECLIAALDEMMTGLKRDSSDTDQGTKKVLKQLKELFDITTGRTAIQLSFF